MSFLRRLLGRATPGQVSSEWPPSTCSCPRHVEEMLEVDLPIAESRAADAGESATVGELLESGALAAQWSDEPGTIDLWIGDEGCSHYVDDAVLSLDEAILDQPGISGVEWYDREAFVVTAPGWCPRGVLAAAVGALGDDRVRRLPDPPV